MSFYKVDPKKMKQLAEDAKPQSGGNDFGEWLKLNAGDTTLRICPPWSKEGTPYRKLVSHNGPFKAPFVTGEGKRVAPLCFRYLFGNDHLAELALDAGKVGPDDSKLFAEFGCPLCVLPQTLNKAGAKDDANQHWPRTQYIWNVINRADGKLYKWSCSKKLATPIEATFKLYDQLFDPTEGRDFTVHATGEGSKRRYDPPVFMPFNSDLGFEGKLNDLDDVMLIGIRSFDALIELAATNNTSFPITDRLTEGMIEYAEAKGII